MGENKAKFFLAIIVGNCFMVPITTSTANPNDQNTETTSLWNGHDDASVSHIDICCSTHPGFMKLLRNETGHVVSKSGVSIEMLDWLSNFIKFEYDCLPGINDDFKITDNETQITDWNNLYKVKQGVCVLSPQAFVMTYSRLKYYCDFPSPISYTPFGLLIPVPQVAIGGISSVWRPFENSVWITLLVSIAITMLLSMFNWLYSRSRVVNVNERKEVRLELHWLFLFGLLMSKAGYSAPDSFKMRLAGGAWCLAALLLTNFYSSVLTSLITASFPVPIVNSVEEVANNDNIELVIVKNWPASALISGGKDTNLLLKKLDIKLKSSNTSICLNISECFQQVAETKTTTFLHDKELLLKLLSEDYHRTGQCNAALAKESFNMMYLSWAISKNYSNFEKLQQGILQMMATGLLGHWKDVYVQSPTQCLIDPSSRQAILAGIRNPALVDLHALRPAFLFLLFGFVLAIMVLLAEWINKVKLWELIPIFRSLPPIQ